MDELYFEEGYLELRYFVVIANASSGSRYFLEGYLPTDYFEYRGSFASVTCDFEIVIIGTTKEFEIAVQSQFDTATAGVKTVSGNALFNSEFTQTANGQRGQDTDLFAFSDAAIQAQVDRIRDINQEATAYFSLSADVARIRALDTDAFGGFSFVGNVQRSRATEMETQAAFSFAVSETLFKDFGADLSDEFTQSVQEDLFKAFDSDITSETAQTVSAQRLCDNEIIAETTSTLSAEFRVVRDAHLTGTGIASITATVNFKTNGKAGLESYAYAYATPPKYVYSRPRNPTDSSLTAGTVSSVVPAYGDKFAYGTTTGTGNIYWQAESNEFDITANENFAFEIFLNAPDSTLNQQPAYVAYGRSLNKTMDTNNLTGDDSWAIGKTATNKLQAVFWNGVEWQYIITTYDMAYSLSTNPWKHIVFRRINGNTVQLLANGVVQGTATFSGAFRQPPLTHRRIKVQNFYSGGFERLMVDEITFRKGGSGSVETYPYRPKNSSNTMFLMRFDTGYEYIDYLGQDITADAALTASSSIYFRSFTNQFGKASINTNFAVSATVGKLEEINLVAFTDAAVITDAGKITENIVASDIDTNQTADVQRLRDIDSDFVIETTQQSQESRIRDNDSQSNIEIVQDTNAEKITDTGSTIESSVSITALGGRLEEINLVAFSDGRIEVSVRKFTSYASDINSEATVNAVIGNKKPLAGDLEAEAAISTTVDRLRDNDSSNNINASVSLDADRLRDVNAAVSTQSKTTNTYIEEEQGLYIDDGYFAEYEIIAQKITDITQNLAVECEISAEIGGSFFAQLVANTNADITANAVKQVSAQVDKAAEFAITALASLIRDFDSSVSAEFAVFANGVTGGEINAVLFNTAALIANAEATKPFDSNLSSEFTQNTETIDSLNGSLESYQSSEFSQSSDVNVVRDAVIETESIATNLTVAVKETAADIVCETRFDIIIDGAKVTDVTSNNDAAFAISNTPVKTADGAADIATEATVTADATVVISAVISTESIASQLSAVARVAAFFVNADVVFTVSADVNVTRSAVSENEITTDTLVDGDAVRYADSDVNVAVTVDALVGVVKPFEATISSAMAFVAGVREIRTDDIVYIIPAEGWTYTIIGEGREYDIIGETRVRKITAESRLRRINGESRIYNIE